MSRQHKIWTGAATLVTALAVILLVNTTIWAHCDGLDGPVVADARVALEAGDVTPVLKWIPEADEQEVREAFDQALVVREQGPEARQLADRYFFETLVRLHRAYEGAPFTGLLPSGAEVSPAIAKADDALEQGDVDELARHIAEAVEASIREHFAAAIAAKANKDESVEAGREYVDEYVQYVHFVKHLHEAVTEDQDYGHGHEAHN
ncbi:DUF6448 family protein [Phycisphaerales bacterium AB-hyl4]|uniref:DUF6448 family protein n=1 Tax=Natronomicrosphaera hydrolytica TaxID=3242702 RepID=A0ABV4U813_9BACT